MRYQNLRLVSFILLTYSSNLQAQECLNNWSDTKAKVSSIQGALECQNNSLDFELCQEKLGLTEASMAVAAASAAGRKALIQEKQKLNNQVCDLKSAWFMEFILPIVFAKNDCALQHAKGQTQLAIESGQKEIQLQKAAIEKRLTEINDELGKVDQKVTYLSESEYANKLDELAKKAQSLPEVKSINQHIAALEEEKKSMGLDRVFQAEKRKVIIENMKSIDREIQELKNLKQNQRFAKAIYVEMDQVRIEQEKARTNRKHLDKFGAKKDVESAQRNVELNQKKVALTNELNQISKMQTTYSEASRRVNLTNSLTELNSQISKMADHGALSEAHLLKLSRAQDIADQHHTPVVPNDRPNFMKKTIRLVKFTGGAAIAVAGEAFAGTIADENCQASNVDSVLNQKLESGSCQWDLELNDKNAGFFFDSENEMKEKIKLNPALCDFIQKTYRDNYPKAQCRSDQFEIQNVRGFNSIISEGSTSPYPQHLILKKGTETFKVEVDENGQAKNILQVQQNLTRSKSRSLTSSKESALQNANRARPNLSKEKEIKNVLQLAQHQMLEASACCSGSLSRPSDRACAEMGTNIRHSKDGSNDKDSSGPDGVR